MRCHICNVILDKIIMDKKSRGGIAPCRKCREVEDSLMFNDQPPPEDYFDPTEDILDEDWDEYREEELPFYDNHKDE